MSAQIASLDITTPQWMEWALNHVQVGILILDAQESVVYCNDWLSKHAELSVSEIVGKTLSDVFPGLKNTYLEKALKRAAEGGLSSFLSNSLHPSPFALYQPRSHRHADRLIMQSVHILPMGLRDSEHAGQRYVLVQINDMTQSVNRERLLKVQAAALNDAARVDSLTGIGNRRHFDEILQQELRHAVRMHAPMSLMLVDLDHFKRYNDTYGHVKGDAALRLTAQALLSSCHRPRDMAARYGGEELVLILPETDLQGARSVALELQSKMLDLNIPHRTSEPLKVLTLSVGVASLENVGDITASDFIEMADAALYQAKSQGRNCICMHDGSTILLASTLTP